MNINRLLCAAAALAVVTTLAACGSSSKESYVSKADQRRELLAKAQAGDAEAQFLVGYELCCGDGDERGRQDLALASRWLCRAAHQGEPRAQYRLGHIYAAGVGDEGLGGRLMRRIGVNGGPPPKLRLAAMWLDLAMAAGHQEAAQQRIALGKRMKAADHIAVEKMRSKWREAPCEWQAVYGVAQAH
ncbi:MAG: hypothetical protein AB7P12_04830 [Alphaproteobacteria bacterium]